MLAELVEKKKIDNIISNRVKGYCRISMVSPHTCSHRARRRRWTGKMFVSLCKTCDDTHGPSIGEPIDQQTYQEMSRCTFVLPNGKACTYHGYYNGRCGMHEHANSFK